MEGAIRRRPKWDRETWEIFVPGGQETRGSRREHAVINGRG